MKLLVGRFFLVALMAITIVTIAGCDSEQDLLLPEDEDGILSEDATEETLSEEPQPDDDGIVSEEPQPEDDGIVWGDTSDVETPAVRIPTISLVKTQVTRLGKVETSFHAEMDLRLHHDLVIVLEVCHDNGRTENVILVMYARHVTSEKFFFGKFPLGETSVLAKLLPYETVLKLDPRMKPINARRGSVDLTKYPVQDRRYETDPENGQVSK